MLSRANYIQYIQLERVLTDVSLTANVARLVLASSAALLLVLCCRLVILKKTYEEVFMLVLKLLQHGGSRCSDFL